MAYLFADNRTTFECIRCKKIKYWYNFKFQKTGIERACFKCLDNHQHIKLKTLFRMASANNMQALRDKLFDAIEDLRAKRINHQDAKEICNIAQTIINSVKVEVEYIKAVGGKVPGTFMQLEENKS